MNDSLVSTAQYSDTDIIRLILAGEKALYEIIIRRYNPYLYKTGRAYGYSHEDTRDLMQETFIDAYKNLSSFEGRASFKTWVTRIMLNNCFRKKQKASYKNEIPSDIDEQSKPMFSTHQHETNRVVQNRELSQTIENALQSIPQDYSLVFTLREINGFNVAETAALLNITESNVKVRLNRARAMLKTEIEKKYTPDDIFEFNLVHCDAIVKNVMTAISEL